MKKIKIISLCLLLLLLMPGLLVNAATDPSRSYVFELTVNEETEAEVNIWEEITLKLVLKRVDDDRTGSYAMHSMQDEIVFDTRFFSLVPQSQQMAAGYSFDSQMMEDKIRRRVKISRVIVDPLGSMTDDVIEVAVFRLKTLIPMEEEAIISQNFKVNSASANTYLSTSNDIYVTARTFDFSLSSVAFISWEDYNALPQGSKLLKLTVPVRLEDQACCFQGQALFYSPLYSDSEEGLHVYLLGVDGDVTEEDVLSGIQLLESNNPVLSYNKDVNQDGRVDSTDVVLVYGFYKGLHQEDPNYTKVSMRKRLEADVNGDGVVDTTDAGAVLDYIWKGRPGFLSP